MPKPFRKGMVPFVIGMLLLPVLWFIIFYVVVNFNSIVLAFRYLAGVTDEGMPIYEWNLNNFQKFFEAFRLDTDDVQVSFWNTLKYFGLNVFVIIPLTYFMSYFYIKNLGRKVFSSVVLYAVYTFFRNNVYSL